MTAQLNVGGRLLDLNEPVVMGILNVTPDSFYAASRADTKLAVIERARQILNEGGAIVDVGACSTRPDCQPVSYEEETQRLRMALRILRQEMPDAVLSVDTFRPDVARMAVEEFGVNIINDVGDYANPNLKSQTSNPNLKSQTSNLKSQTDMFRMVSRLGVPYILMSAKPTLHTILLDLAEKVQQLRDFGQKDIIIDPGFGFGKTLAQNYEVMDQLQQLQVLELPILVGVSRKSMIYRLLGLTPEDALPGTIALNTLALMKGANILRVHDVKEAVHCCKINAQFTMHNAQCSMHNAQFTIHKSQINLKPQTSNLKSK